MLTDDAQGMRREDLTIDASLFGLFALDAFESTDPRVVATMEAVRTQLQVQTDVGCLRVRMPRNYRGQLGPYCTTDKFGRCKMGLRYF